MSNILPILEAFLISQGAHTGGHLQEAEIQNVPIDLNLKHMSENWEIRPYTLGLNEIRKSPWGHLWLSNEERANDENRRRAAIHGAGFSMQDRVRDMIDDPETKNNVSNMGALIKGLYIAGIPGKMSKELGKLGGDIEGMKRSSGNKYVKHLVGASALADVYGIPVQFTTVGGAPGLVFNRRF